MQTVLSYIDERKIAYEDHRLFHYIVSGGDPLAHVKFMKQAAYFIMSFSDLNKYAMRVQPASDLWQELVNKHTLQDDHHWAWYLQDFERLGWNEQSDVISTLRWLWSDQLNANRILTGELWGMCSAASSLEKLIIIEAIEATGEVLFQRLAQRAEEYADRSNTRPLIYLGDHHFAVEQGHSSGDTQADARLAALELDAGERSKAQAIVDRVFALFTRWIDQLHDVAVTENVAS